MELRQLEAFSRVVQTRNFTRAAEELSLTQPAVTRQIAGLEKELGTRLLERLGRRVEPTPAGAVLLEYATQVLRLVDEAQAAVNDVSAGERGTLSVGASSTAATYFLPSRLGVYAAAHPAVEISVHTGPSGRILEMVESNAVDLGVVMDFPGRRGLRSSPLGQYATVVVAPPGHELAAGNDASPGQNSVEQRDGANGRGRIAEGKGLSGQVESGQISVETLALYPLLLMQRGTSLRRTVDELFAASGLTPRISMEFDSVEAIKQMVVARLGVSVLPELSVRAEVAAGQLLALPMANSKPRRIEVVQRSDKFVTRAMQSFLTCLAEPEPLKPVQGR